MQGLYGHFTTNPPAIFFAMRPNLDQDLYNLACRCASADGKLRPPLAKLFATVQSALRDKTGPQDFPGAPFAVWESDEKIDQYVREMILSAEYLKEDYNNRMNALRPPH